MIIRKDESIEMLELLQIKQKLGYAWMVYDGRAQMLRLIDIQCFRKFDEARKFQQKNEAAVHAIVLVQPVIDFIKNSLQVKSSIADRIAFHPDTIRIELNSLKVFTIERSNARERAEQVSRELMDWGFPHDLTQVLEPAMKGSLDPIVLDSKRSVARDRLETLLFLAPDSKKAYHINAMSCSLKRHIEIPDLTISNVSAIAIEKEMRTIDWERVNPSIIDTKKTDVEQQLLIDQAMDIYEKLERLSIITEGKDVAEKLMAKYWLGTPVEAIIDNANELDNKFIIRQNFETINGVLFTAHEAYNLMCERYVSKEILEGSEKIHPWYYRHAEGGESFDNIVCIGNSEKINMYSHIDKLKAKNYQFDCSAEELIKRLRSGDNVKMDQVFKDYKQENYIYFNPFLNQIEISKLGPKQQLNLSQDIDLKKGRSL